MQGLPFCVLPPLDNLLFFNIIKEMPNGAGGAKSDPTNARRKQVLDDLDMVIAKKAEKLANALGWTADMEVGNSPFPTSCI